MSANPSKPRHDIVAPAEADSRPATGPAFWHGHEALEALLAFSSLHDQIRQHRLRLAENKTGSEASWHLQHFQLDEVLQLVANRALAVTGADGVAVALAEGDAIVCRAVAGKIVPDAGVRLDPTSGFSGACWRGGAIVRCDDSEADPRVNKQACRRLGARAMVAVPLAAGGRVLGLLEAFSSDAYGFNDSDVRSLNLLAELILSALRPEELERLREVSGRVVSRPNPAPPAQAAPSPPLVIAIDSSSARSASAAPSWPEPAPAVEVEAEAAKTETIKKEKEKIEIKQEKIEIIEDEGQPEVRAPVFNLLASGEEARPGTNFLLVMLVLAALVGLGVWLKMGSLRRALASPPSPSTHQAAASSAEAAPVAPAPPRPGVAAGIDSPAAADSAPGTAAESSSEPAPASAVDKNQTLPAVTGIRHWSSPDSSTVVIDLEDQVQYEAHRLPDPERIYFDLHDTALSVGPEARSIDIEDPLLVRVRVAQPAYGITRVVLETRDNSSYSVSLEENPYRLVVKVRKAGSKSRAGSDVDLFAPAAVAGSASIAAGNTSAAPAALGSASELAKAAKTHLRAPPFRIVLDAGHGGWDLGTVGQRGLLEKDLVLDIVNRLGKLVEQRLGAEVIYTRQQDIYLPLEKRAEIANLAKADLFLSVHANYSDYASARGVETYYTRTYSSLKARTAATAAAEEGQQDLSWTKVDIREKVQQSRRFATSVQDSLYSSLAAENPGLRDRGVKQAAFVVLTGASMPAILAEVSFVSSPTDESELGRSSYRQQIAVALYRGLARYQAGWRRERLAQTASSRATLHPWAATR